MSKKDVAFLNQFVKSILFFCQAVQDERGPRKSVRQKIENSEKSAESANSNSDKISHQHFRTDPVGHFYAHHPYDRLLSGGLEALGRNSSSGPLYNVRASLPHFSPTSAFKPFQKGTWPGQMLI